MGNSQSDYQISQETQEIIARFNQADQDLKKLAQEFEERHSSEIGAIERLREERNRLLDEAKKALRKEAEQAPYTKVRTLSIGAFNAVKKWQNYYNPERFVAIAEDRGVLAKLLEAGVVKIHHAIGACFEKDAFKNTRQWLADRGWADDFAEAEDGGELTPSVTAPGQVAGVLTEYKPKG